MKIRILLCTVNTLGAHPLLSQDMQTSTVHVQDLVVTVCIFESTCICSVH